MRATTPEATTASKNASPIARIDGNGIATAFGMSSETFGGGGETRRDQLNDGAHGGE